jgi:hypothetical protein
MTRPALIAVAAIFAASPVYAQNRGLEIPIPFTLPSPTNPATLLPYVSMVHHVLDVVTTRESAVNTRSKLALSETRSEWVVHRIKANVWVEKTSMNYLGQISVRVSIPCIVEFSLDMSAIRYGQMHYDPARKLLTIELPPLQIRDPMALLPEMKIEPQYHGLRGTMLDSEKVRRLQDQLVKEDYVPAAREAAMEVYAYAQRKARDQVQEFLQGLFKDAGADIEVVVK